MKYVKTTFLYDEKGKCTNPETFFSNKKQFATKFNERKKLYFEIMMCEKKGYWAISCHYPRSDTPFIRGDYKKREHAIEAAVFYLKMRANGLANIMPKINDDKIVVFAALDFLKFMNSLKLEESSQLGLF